MQIAKETHSSPKVTLPNSSETTKQNEQQRKLCGEEGKSAIYSRWWFWLAVWLGRKQLRWSVAD